MAYRALLALVTGWGLCSAALLPAATSYPMLLSTTPVAVQAGKTSDVTVRSRYSMEGAYRVLVSGTGVVGEVRSPARIENAPRLAGKKKPAKTRRPTMEESLTVRFRVDKDALPGPRDFRIAGACGVSTVGQLVIVRDPVISESKDNDTVQTAQRIGIPAAVCGCIEKIEDRDYYKFHAAAGQSLTFRVRGMALEDRIHDLQMHLDPIITLRGPTGTTVAVGDNDLSGDPTLCYAFSRGGDYTLEIRDVRYKGQREWVYCVEISDRPLVRNVFPLAVAAGTLVQFEPIGFQLPNNASLEWTVPKNWRPGMHRSQLPLGGGLMNPVALLVCDCPIVRESDGDNNVVKKSERVPVPVAINGRIATEGDTDVYSFAAKKGETYTFEVVARRAGSPLDAVLRMLDGKGRELSEADDTNELGQSTADATLETWTAPADGVFGIEIRDLLQRGGPEFVYVLRINRAEPAFDLFLDTDKTELVPGASGVLFVNSIRKHGFDGPIELSVSGLPPGATAFCEPIAADQRDGMILFSAAADAKPAVSNIVVTGHARSRRANGSMVELQATGVPLQETYVPGGAVVIGPSIRTPSPLPSAATCEESY